MILPFYFLFSIVPGGLLLWVSSRIRQGQPPEQAARRLFHFLLLVFFALLIFVMSLDPRYQTSFWTIPFIPILAALIPIIYLHWRATPSLHTRQITLTLWLAVIAAILLGFIYGQIRRDVFLPLVVFGTGCIVTFAWWAVQASRWGRIMNRIGIGVLLAGVGINTFAQNALLETWPEWFQALLTVMTWLLAAVLTVQVGKVLYAHATGHFSQNRRQMLAAWGWVGLMACLLFYQTAETSILDTATDGLGTVMIFTIICLSAIAVALLLAWKLEQRRFQTVFVYVTAMMLTITVAFTVVTRLDPQQVMVERAGMIDRAVQAYYEANAYYPSDLNALIPRYLLFVPNPVLFHDQTWCYEGGADYYRFGYLYRRYFGMPPERIQMQGSAGTPPAETWVCDSQFAAFMDRAGIDFAG